MIVWFWTLFFWLHTEFKALQLSFCGTIQTDIDNSRVASPHCVEIICSVIDIVGCVWMCVSFYVCKSVYFNPFGWSKFGGEGYCLCCFCFNSIKYIVLHKKCYIQIKFDRSID